MACWRICVGWSGDPGNGEKVGSNGKNLTGDLEENFKWTETSKKSISSKLAQFFQPLGSFQVTSPNFNLA